jgi:hypothetical protein
LLQLEPDLESSLFSPLPPVLPPADVQEQELFRQDGMFPDSVVTFSAFLRGRKKRSPAFEADRFQV